MAGASRLYDLTSSAGATGRGEDWRLLAMAIGRLPNVDPRWANRANLISSAEHFGYSREEADALISDMKERVSARWRPLMLEMGDRPVVADLVAHAFPDRYPGFEYLPTDGEERETSG